jgi:hypothetical protein
VEEEREVSPGGMQGEEGGGGRGGARWRWSCG